MCPQVMENSNALAMSAMTKHDEINDAVLDAIALTALAVPGGAAPCSVSRRARNSMLSDIQDTLTICLNTAGRWEHSDDSEMEVEDQQRHWPVGIRAHGALPWQNFMHARRPEAFCAPGGGCRPLLRHVAASLRGRALFPRLGKPLDRRGRDLLGRLGVFVDDDVVSRLGQGRARLSWVWHSANEKSGKEAWKKAAARTVWRQTSTWRERRIIWQSRRTLCSNAACDIRSCFNVLVGIALWCTRSTRMLSAIVKSRTTSGRRSIEPTGTATGAEAAWRYASGTEGIGEETDCDLLARPATGRSRKTLRRGSSRASRGPLFGGVARADNLGVARGACVSAMASVQRKLHPKACLEVKATGVCVAATLAEPRPKTNVTSDCTSSINCARSERRDAKRRQAVQAWREQHELPRKMDGVNRIKSAGS